MDSVLRDARVARLLAVLLPSVYKAVHPKFKQARDTFDMARRIMADTIGKHREDNDDDNHKDKEMEDFVDAYLTVKQQQQQIAVEI